jgi:hypothetical protein
MSDEQFTRADWRPGKRRRSTPRVRDWGGRKQLSDGLRACGATHGFGSGKQKRCKHCKRFAYKDTGLCGHHGGPQVAMKQGRACIRTQRSLAWHGVEARGVCAERRDRRAAKRKQKEQQG